MLMCRIGSYVLGIRSPTTAIFPSLPPLVLSRTLVSVCLFLKPGFAIHSAQPQCFLHADHYCIPLLPYVSVRLICTLQYFTRLGLIPSLDLRDIDPLCCFTIKEWQGSTTPDCTLPHSRA